VIFADLVDVEEMMMGGGLMLGRPLTKLAQTVSTNDDAKAAARAGAPHGAAWVAESQTQGRGRQGRTWLSAPSENLLFSVLVRLQCPPAGVPRAALAAGLAVRDAVARSLGADADGDVLIKWPNDVVIRDANDGVHRKVAGVLVESSVSGSVVSHLVVGVGLNVHTRMFDETLADAATSVTREREARGIRECASRAELFVDVLRGLTNVERVAHKGLLVIHSRLVQYDVLLGRAVESFEGAELRGTASGIDTEGRLLVRRDDGTLARVVSGEVRLRC
jgi:BirA family biotin operon repressor/biotin-[acetyl-CoA-carboxylase] ligase